MTAKKSFLKEIGFEKIELFTKHFIEIRFNQ